VQLKRRYDLIPNLVETVKGYAGHEREVLARVVELRNSAASLSSGTRRPVPRQQLKRPPSKTCSPRPSASCSRWQRPIPT
jgi:hypothetical protein